MQAGEPILVVDSGAAVRARLQSILVDLGYTVELVDGFAAAVAAFGRGNWALAIVAYTLGDGSGLELARAIGHLQPGTAVILVGDRRQATALAALRGGAVDYLPLPINEIELAATVERALQLRAGQPGCIAQRHGSAAQPTLQDAAPRGAGWPARLAVSHELASILAHEINNPLTPIIGLAEMLLEDLPLDHPDRTYATAISLAAWRIRDVVRSLCEATEDRAGEAALQGEAWHEDPADLQGLKELRDGPSTT
jgi:DNA-binding response OmpR family regulator